MAASSANSLNGKIGALESWSRTVDRTGRTAKARRNSPASVEYWIERVDDTITDPEARRRAGAEKHRAHMLRLSKASRDARKSRT